MALWLRLISAAARRIAANPVAREKAKQVYEAEIKPRARKAKAGIKSELNDIAKDTDPKVEPARFAGRLARRMIDRVKGK